MFVINKHDEEMAKVYLKRLSRPFTKFMPVEFKGYIYNARFVQNIYKKLMKRGNGVYITEVTLSRGIITINYRTPTGKGSYKVCPLAENWKGYTPKVTTEIPVELA